MKKRSLSVENVEENIFISTDLIQKLVSEVEDGGDTAEGDQGQVNNLYPLLMKQDIGRDSWNKGTRGYNNNAQTDLACTV